MDVSKFIGLSKHRAQDKAEQLYFVFRLIRVDDNQIQAYPEDIRDDRVCVEIDNGQVTKAIIS